MILIGQYDFDLFNLSKIQNAIKTGTGNTQVALATIQYGCLEQNKIRRLMVNNLNKSPKMFKRMKGG